MVANTEGQNSTLIHTQLRQTDTDFPLLVAQSKSKSGTLTKLKERVAIARVAIVQCAKSKESMQDEPEQRCDPIVSQ